MSSFRPQYLSLTLLNWNGFFAKTFDLDPEITALSGGNGSGKSTVLAAFLSAIVPDLSLLQFRNATDGSLSGHLRDKGLHGKINLGECYALLKARTDENEIVLFGVHLQRQPSRDGKLQLRPLILTNLTLESDPISLFTQAIDESENMRILSPMQLQKNLKNDAVICKFCSSITDYHHQLFLMGLLSKSFRTPQERGQLYKLLQASLHGGVPSSIINSLKTYLLPEQLGLKSAFKELETALFENKMTLTALKDAEIFHQNFSMLLHGASRYLLAEYARWVQTLKAQRMHALTHRKKYYFLKKSSIQALDNERALHQKSVDLDALLCQKEAAQRELSQQQQQLIQIAQYQKELSENSALQNQHEASFKKIVREQELKTETIVSLQKELDAAQALIEKFYYELSNQQVALNARQMRGLQFQQAKAVFSQAQRIVDISDHHSSSLAYLKIEVEKIEEHYNAVCEKEVALERSKKNYHAREEQGRELRLKMNAALTDVASLNNDTSVNNLTKFERLKIYLEKTQISFLRYDLFKNEMLEAQKNHERLIKYSNIWKCASRLIEKTMGHSCDNIADLNQKQRELIDEIQSCQTAIHQLSTQQALLLYQQEELAQLKKVLHQQSMQWEKTQRSKMRLERDLSQSLNSSKECQDRLLELRLELQQHESEQREKNEEIIKVQRELIDLEEPYAHHFSEKIRKELREVAETINAIPLIEFLENTPLEEAKTLSAFLEPFQAALVVDDVDAAKMHLQNIMSEPLTATFYLFSKASLESPERFFQAAKHELGIWIEEKVFSGVRYTPFPTVPWVGQKARAHQRTCLSSSLQDLKNEERELFNVSAKKAHLVKILEQFMVEDCAIFFQNQSINQKFQDANARMHEVEIEQVSVQKACSVAKEKIEQLKECARAIDALDQKDCPILPNEAALKKSEEDHNALHKKFVLIKEEHQFFLRFGELLEDFSKKVEFLKDNENFSLKTWNSNLVVIQSEKKDLMSKIFVLKDLIERWEHLLFQEDFEKKDRPETLQVQLNEKIKRQELMISSKKSSLEIEQSALEKIKESGIQEQFFLEKHQGMRHVLENNLLKALSSLPSELQTFFDEETTARVTEAFQNTQSEVSLLQLQRQDLTQQWAKSLANVAQLKKELQLGRQEYVVTRRQLLKVKEQILALKQQLFELSLDEFLLDYVDKNEDQLRQEADEAVGILRDLTKIYPHLREALQTAQNSGTTDHKIIFFKSVLEFLRQRLRKDLLETQSPFHALSVMQTELGRLKKELNDREKKLRISTQGIAQLIQRSIQRERHRIDHLNQALSGIGFGQIEGIRLNLKLLQSHHEFLEQLTSSSQLSLFSEHEVIEDNQSFLERLGTLYCKINPITYQGSVNLAELGEKLLDYRSYLTLSVEIQRQAKHWITADVGTLSTGEAIGVGITLLLMIVQSWEEETSRLRGKNRTSCRILPLDEAARLDALSLATLTQLCKKLQLQLFLAAPETLQAHHGTTYQLRRIYIGNKAHVHVIGLRRL